MCKGHSDRPSVSNAWMLLPWFDVGSALSTSVNVEGKGIIGWWEGDPPVREIVLLAKEVHGRFSGLPPQEIPAGFCSVLQVGFHAPLHLNHSSTVHWRLAWLILLLFDRYWQIAYWKRGGISIPIHAYAAPDSASILLESLLEETDLTQLLLASYHELRLSNFYNLHLDLFPSFPQWMLVVCKRWCLMFWSHLMISSRAVPHLCRVWTALTHAFSTVSAMENIVMCFL